MKTPLRRPAPIACVCCLGLAAAAIADSPAPTDTDALSSRPSSPLAGPAVETPDHADTLTRRGYDGKIRDLDSPPAFAALELLDLTDAERAKVASVLDERAKLMDDLVLGNLLLLSELEPVFAAGTPADKINMMFRAAEALRPVTAWGELRERLAAALPPAAAERYDRLIADHERAKFQELRDSGEIDSAWQFRIARRFELIGWEVERAAERVLTDNGEDTFAEIIETLELSPAQEATIRRKAEAFYIKHKGRPTEAAEAGFFLEMLAELDGKQRIGLILMAIKGDLEDDPMMMD